MLAYCCADERGFPCKPILIKVFQMKRSCLTTKAFCISLLASAISLQAVGEAQAGEGQVDIVAWPGYIERGETDAAYDWVTQFEKNTGCAVNVKTASTSDDLSMEIEAIFDPSMGV